MSDFYGLDPDLATTALAGEGEVKVFVEVAPFSEPDSLSFENDAVLWGTDVIEYGEKALGSLEPDNLPVQQIADHRLVSIPSVSSSSALGIGFSNFTFSLVNNDDKFTTVDYIGARCRLWGIDSTTRRIVATGKITAQTIRLATADFTVSSSPVRELSEHFPRRQMDDETFPYGNNLGERDVPVVVGRVEFVELIKIGDKISTTLTSAVSVGDSVLNLAETAGIAVADRLVIGLATENKEIVTVHSVDVDASTVALTGLLENAHLISDTVTNEDTQIDYLIGEGVIPSVDDVYNEGRLLREYEAELPYGVPVGTSFVRESTGSRTFPGRYIQDTFIAGLNWIQLPKALRVPLKDWYIGFTITLGDQSATIESYHVEAADADDETRVSVAALPFVVSFTLASSVDVRGELEGESPTFSLKSYRLFDGSQDYPYPTYAFIRFATEGITGNVHANVRGLTTETNPARLIESVLSHSRWGAGATVDSASFTTATAAVSDLKYEGVFSSRVTVEDIIQQVAVMRELELSNSGSGVSLSFATTRSSSVTLPSRIEDYLNPPPEMFLAPLDETVKDITLRYRPGTRSNEWQGELTANVVDIEGGLEQKLDFVNVWTTEVADRILHYYESLGRARRKRMKLTTHLLVKRGDVVTLPALSPFTTEASDWEVLEVNEEGNISNVVTLASYDPDTYVYPAGRTLEEPLPIEFVPDYTQTFPPPVTNLQVSSCNIRTPSATDREIYIDVTWDDPDDDNYNGAILRYRFTGDADTSSIEYGRNLMSRARFPINIGSGNVTIFVYSQSPNNELEGLGVSAIVQPNNEDLSDLQLPNPTVTESVTSPSLSTSTIGKWFPTFAVDFDAFTAPADFRHVYLSATHTENNVASHVHHGDYHGPYTTIASFKGTAINMNYLDYSVETASYNFVIESHNNAGCVLIQEVPGSITVDRPAGVGDPDDYAPAIRLALAYRGVSRSGNVLTFTVRVSLMGALSHQFPSDWDGFRLQARPEFLFGRRADGSRWYSPGFNSGSFTSFPSASGEYEISNFPQDITVTLDVGGSSPPSMMEASGSGRISVYLYSVRGSQTLLVAERYTNKFPAATF